MKPTICIALHDVAPATWSRCERLLNAVAEVAPVPVTLLVVPAWHGDLVDPHDARGTEWRALLNGRCARGDELVLHGWRHLDDVALPSWSFGPRSLSRAAAERLKRRLYTAGEGEFSALDEREAARRLREGLNWFAANGWRSNGFVAPAWMLGQPAWAALARLQFAWTTTWKRFWLLPEREAHLAPCITASTRAGWRRLASRAWMRAYAQTNARRPIVRLGLHPGDADDPGIVSDWQRLIESLLKSRVARVKSDLALRLRTSKWTDALRDAA